jgi:hypothetical protein
MRGLTIVTYGIVAVIVWAGDAQPMSRMGGDAGEAVVPVEITSAPASAPTFAPQSPSSQRER